MKLLQLIIEKPDLVLGIMAALLALEMVLYAIFA